MLTRFVYIAPSPVAIPQGQNYLTVAGLQLSYFNPAPSKVMGQVKGDQSAAIYPIDVSAITTIDNINWSFTVTFNTNIPNGNFTYDFTIL